MQVVNQNSHYVYCLLRTPLRITSDLQAHSSHVLQDLLPLPSVFANAAQGTGGRGGGVETDPGVAERLQSKGSWSHTSAGSSFLGTTFRGQIEILTG